MDLTNFTNQLTEKQAIELCHKAVSQQSLIILFASTIIIFLFWGFVLTDKKKESMRTLMMIFAATFVTLGIIFLFLFFLPVTTQTVVEAIKNFFSF